eukprot:7386005-Prymnesium_polylepis.2
MLGLRRVLAVPSTHHRARASRELVRQAERGFGSRGNAGGGDARENEEASAHYPPNPVPEHATKKAQQTATPPAPPPDMRPDARPRRSTPRPRMSPALGA